LIKVQVRPNIVLSAEKELGIVAGLQDRVAQVYGGLVHMVSVSPPISYIAVGSIGFMTFYHLLHFAGF
jgi:hypothetical protein